MRAVVLAVFLATLTQPSTRWSGTAGVDWAVFVDDLHVQFRQTGRLRQIVQALARLRVAPDDRCTARCSGPSCASGSNAVTACEVLRTWRAPTGNGLREDDQLGLQSAMTERENAERAERALAAAAAHIRDAPAGATVVFISNGYLADGRTIDQLANVADLAAGKGIRIFPVLTRSEDYDPAQSPSLTPDDWRRLTGVTLASLTVLASRTRGVVITNPLAGGLDRIDAPR